MPEEAGVVIVGAGAFGCAAAYHLARRGVQGVLVLDRRGIATQTTPRAAGLTATLRPTELMSAIARESAEFFARFEAEVGQPLGFQRVGSIRVALTASASTPGEEIPP